MGRCATWSAWEMADTARAPPRAGCGTSMSADSGLAALKKRRRSSARCKAPKDAFEASSGLPAKLLDAPRWQTRCRIPTDKSIAPDAWSPASHSLLCARHFGQRESIARKAVLWQCNAALLRDQKDAQRYGNVLM